MSHYGSPPDPEQDPSTTPGQPGAPAPGAGSDTGGPSPEQPAYNPYPDNWNTAPPPPTNPYAAQSPYGGPGDQQTPYGQQNPYGAPSQSAASPGAPANPYASTRPDRPTFGFGGYAGWWTRVGATLIDQFIGTIAGLPLWIGYVMLLSNLTTTTDAQGVSHVHFHSNPGAGFLIVVGAITSLIFYVWNVFIRQGRTGATIGKSMLAIRLVNADLQPIGPGWAFLRQVLHIVDSLPCDLGYLWPIWDSRKQTFADKIMSTFVIQATEPQPPGYPPPPTPYQTY